MSDRLKNKNIIITGASFGVGLELASLCANRGANLVLLARSIEKLEQIKHELEDRFSVSVFVYKLDVSNSDEIERIFLEIKNELGHVDILVNNAGFGMFKEADHISLDEVKAMFNVNVIGLMACTSMVLPWMKERRSGHIINVASMAGKVATPKSSAYCATKHAVLGYTNSLRLELAEHNVFVTAVNPGPIMTNFFTIADKKGTYVNSVKKYMLTPVYVAEKIVNCMLTQTREINLPRWMNAGSVIYALFPRAFERIGKRAFNKK
ncbi:SDR family oxidoreductase [Bacillus sp. 03113]|uniref:SDR family NAD(P)-dependent oxidoreductase n=1 Tax=Bacillus sp. 03113 TaxID=2578211 RepID=UPI0011428620|nr:SDR family oxidoreductase [Bacillus sp. 03113]